jgi:hypothetical protein
MQFARLHGVSAVKRAFEFLKDYREKNNPVLPTPEERNDLFVRALASGAGINISCEVDAWRWQISAPVRSGFSQSYPGDNSFCRDGDGDGYRPTQDDFNDLNAAVHPGAVELTNGVDDDCDGYIDDIVFKEGIDFNNPSFQNAPTVPLPVRITGRAESGNWDNFRVEVHASERINIRLRSIGSYAGWWQRLEPFTTIAYIPPGETGHGHVFLEAGKHPFALIPQDSNTGDYEVIVSEYVDRSNPVSLRVTPGPNVNTVRITATVDLALIGSEQPTSIRFWSDGMGFFQSMPFSQTTSFELMMPVDGGSVGLRAQLVAQDHPVSKPSDPLFIQTCIFTLTSTSASISALAGTGSVNFTSTSSDCLWTATSNASFITITSPASGTGNGTINYSVSTNTSPSARSGTLTIGGQTFTVNQAAPTLELVVLTAGQAEIKTWTFQGKTYAYLKLSFPSADYRVANWGQAVRVGNDFSADATVHKFSGASVQAVTTTAGVYELEPLAGGNYTFTFKNSGTVVKSQAFSVSSAIPAPNPIDDAREFVKWQYRDFLNREPDQAGEDYWTDNITKCSDPARRPPGQTVETCTLRQRETTSGAFFVSPEFQYTGYFVYRMYQGALGRQPKLSEFTPDAQFVGAGIVVSGQLSGAKIEQNKAAFAQQFVNCTDPAKYRCGEFKAIYDGLSNQAYVDKLFQTTGVNASATDRAALVNELNANPTTGRAMVLQKVVDGITVISEGNQQFNTTYGQAFYNSEFNRAFVQLEYFGYMKRDPDADGFAHWLGKLNLFGGDFVAAEMVLAFITSPEYRSRFGQP